MDTELELNVVVEVMDTVMEHLLVELDMELAAVLH